MNGGLPNRTDRNVVTGYYPQADAKAYTGAS